MRPWEIPWREKWVRKKERKERKSPSRQEIYERGRNRKSYTSFSPRERRRSGSMEGIKRK